MVFCRKCGSELKPDYKFCPQCGTQNVSTISKEEEKKKLYEKITGKFSLPSFSKFKSKREAERQSFFVRKPANKKSKIEEKDVCIQVGVMKDKETIKRGENLPVKVLQTYSSDEVKHAAITKHAAFNKRFKGGKEDYDLVFKDGTEVVFVPGTNPPEPFSVVRYKEESGLGYARIVFYLLPKSSEGPEILSSSGSESSDDDDHDGGTLQPVLWLQNKNSGATKVSSTSTKASTSTATYSSDSEASKNPPSSSKMPEKEAQCPTCFEFFPVSQIMEHADTCADWLIDFASPSTTGTALCENEQLDIIEKTAESNTSTIKDLILDLQHNLSKDESTTINIRRKTMWEDFAKERKRKFTPDSKVQVVFLGEPAVDDGGPRRELFSDLLDIAHKKYFQDGRPTKSMLALSAESFQLTGEIMTMSILQGGPAPNFLASDVYSYLSREPLSPENNEDPLMRDTATRIANAKTDSELHNILIEDKVLDVLGTIGYQGVPQRETIVSSKAIVRSICLTEQLSEYLPQLMQLEEGLSICGLLRSIQQHPKVWEPVFKKDHNGENFFSAKSLLNGAIVDFSLSQVLKDKEIDTYKAFKDTLYLLEEKDETIGITTEEFTKFLTGCKTIPPLGLPQKLFVKFVHGCSPACRCRPSASTCDLVLKLPVHINTEEDMKAMLESSVKESLGFGNI